MKSNNFYVCSGCGLRGLVVCMCAREEESQSRQTTLFFRVARDQYCYYCDNTAAAFVVVVWLRLTTNNNLLRGGGDATTMYVCMYVLLLHVLCTPTAINIVYYIFITILCYLDLIILLHGLQTAALNMLFKLYK